MSGCACGVGGMILTCGVGGMILTSGVGGMILTYSVGGMILTCSFGGMILTCSVGGMMLTGENRSVGIKSRAIVTLCTAPTAQRLSGLSPGCRHLPDSCTVSAVRTGFFTFLAGHEGYFVHVQLQTLLFAIKKFFRGGICVP